MTAPKSFRLTQEARDNLAKLADDYDFSESKIINLLLTIESRAPYLENPTIAAKVLHEHFENLYSLMLEARAVRIAQRKTTE